MTVREIVTEYLKANGYDGLAGEECGCWLHDLMPCGEYGTNCVAGHEGNPPENNAEDADCWMYPGKREEAKP